MKKATTIIWIACILIVSCTSKKVLSKEDAFQQIQKGKQFPKIIDYDLYCGDPQQAKKVLDAGLETDGLLKVQRTQKLSDVGRPLISLTDKAQIYLYISVMVTPHSGDGNPSTERPKSERAFRVF